jgi:hypothetical protein
MRHIGFTTFAHLAIMGLLGIIVCPPNCFHLSGFKVFVETLCEGVNGRHNLASVLVHGSMVTEKLYKWGSLVATLLNLLTKMHKKRAKRLFFWDKIWLY